MLAVAMSSLGTTRAGGRERTRRRHREEDRKDKKGCKENGSGKKGKEEARGKSE